MFGYIGYFFCCFKEGTNAFNYLCKIKPKLYYIKNGQIKLNKLK